MRIIKVVATYFCVISMLSIYCTNACNAQNLSQAEIIAKFNTYLESISSAKLKYSLDMPDFKSGGNASWIMREKPSFFDSAWMEINGEKKDLSDISIVSGKYIQAFYNNYNNVSENGLLVLSQNTDYSKEDTMVFLCCPPLLGFCPFANGKYINILDLLKRSNNVSITDLEEDSPVAVSISTDNYMMQISFMPQYGYAIKKLRIQRNTPVTDLNLLKENSPYDYYEYLVKEFGETASVYYPKKFSVSIMGVQAMYDFDEKKNEYVGKFQKSPTSMVYTIDSFVPDKSLTPAMCAIKTTIPNGTPVYMQDAPQIEYIWMDGKIVPKTDELMLAIARGGHKFMPGVSEPRFWLMAIGLIVIIVAGGIKLRRFLAGRE
ncbi:MAG: hypothetical protein ACRC2T_03150 [Thermoguttaceae bacterium]